MAVLRCTRKLLNELAIAPSTVADTEGDLAGWHANLLCIERRKCVLFTNDLTLYSIFVPALRKPQFQDIAGVFGQAVFRSLRLAEFTQVQIETVLDTIHGDAGFRIAKTSNRRVLGSMMDLTFSSSGWLHPTGVCSGARLTRSI